MRISKIKIDKTKTDEKKLKEIDLTRKTLGPTVALIGKNGAGKSRILHFVETYIQSLTTQRFLEDHFINIPFTITGNIEQNITSARQITKTLQKPDLTAAQVQQITKTLNAQISPIITRLKQLGPAYIKVVDNDDLKVIKSDLDNKSQISFEQILNNQHFERLLVTSQSNPNQKTSILLNEFSALNTQSALEYFKNLTSEIVTDEFGLYLKNRNSLDKIDEEIKKKKSYQSFGKFQKYVKQFLGKEFSYEQAANGNKVESVLHFNGRPFDLTHFSPGQKTLFAYAILLFYLEINTNANLRESIIIIDEPEKHLHPEAQIKLINALKEITNKSGQLWIATHSVHILSHLEYDEIMMVQDDEIIPPSRTTPGKSFNDLMGMDDHIIELIAFINSISEWAYGNFMLQCFKEPDVILGGNVQDPQFQLFKEFIFNNENLKLLDYGAGKGRMGYTLKEDHETASRIRYSAFEPDKNNYIHLNNVPEIQQLYSKPQEIPALMYDCVLLCNVLHEINPKEWVDTLLNIKRVLNDDGYLLIIEDKFLPKGENAHQFGYLILDTTGTKILMNSEKCVELKIENVELRDRILFNAFRKDQINPDTISVTKAVQSIKETSFNNIRKLRKNLKDAAQGRRYANETQLYINAQLFLESSK